MEKIMVNTLRVLKVVEKIAILTKRGFSSHDVTNQVIFDESTERDIQINDKKYVKQYEIYLKNIMNGHAHTHLIDALSNYGVFSSRACIDNLGHAWVEIVISGSTIVIKDGEWDFE